VVRACYPGRLALTRGAFSISLAHMLPTITSRAVADAPVEAVWTLLRDPERWAEFQPLVSGVEGAHTPLEAGQQLSVVSRFLPRRTPVEIRVVHPQQRLAVTAHPLPGLIAEIDHLLVPLARGRTDVEVRMVVSGPLAVPSWPTLRASSLLTTRSLAVTAGRLAAA
jgi:hypothetical protein